MVNEVGCCAVSRESNNPTVAQAEAVNGSTEGMILLEGGLFLMGTDYKKGFPADGEGPIREVTLNRFL